MVEILPHLILMLVAAAGLVLLVAWVSLLHHNLGVTGAQVKHQQLLAHQFLMPVVVAAVVEEQVVQVVLALAGMVALPA